MEISQIIFFTILCLCPINAKQERKIDQKLSILGDISKTIEDAKLFNITKEPIQEEHYFNKNINTKGRV